MTALVVASILNPLNTSSLATALTSITTDMHATAGQGALLVAAVYITSAVAQPVMGTLATRLGAWRVLVGGLLLVVAAGLVGGFATSITALLASRVLIGIGTSSAVPSAMVLLRHRAEQRGIPAPTKELAVLTAAGNVIAAAGLPVGGLLVQFFGWRSVFLINAPVAIIAIVLAFTWLPRSRPAGGRQPQPTRLDGQGIVLFTATIIALAVFLQDVTNPIWWILGLTVVLGVALSAWELRAGRRGLRQPFIDVQLIASSAPLRAIYLRTFVLSLSVYSTLYGLAQWLGLVHGMSSSAVGILMLPQSILAAVAAFWAGRQPLVRRFVLAAGFLLMIAAVALSGAALGGSIALAIATTVAMGLAFGVGMVGNQSALYLASTTEQFGVASGLLRTSSYVGGFAAMAIMGLIYASGVTDAALAGFAVVFLISGVATVLLGWRHVPVGTEPDSDPGETTSSGFHDHVGMPVDETGIGRR